MPSDHCESLWILDPLQKEGPTWAILYVVGTLWLFLGIAHVSEEYFAESISQIIVQYNIPASVAGATLMAAGSSSPELIAEFVGVIIGDTDTSTGTVIGSAVFNQLFIIGGAILVSPGQTMKLDWRSQARDMLAYAVTIAIMIVFFWDGTVVAYEAVAMVLAYLTYVGTCAYWESIERALCMNPEHLALSQHVIESEDSTRAQAGNSEIRVDGVSHDGVSMHPSPDTTCNNLTDALLLVEEDSSSHGGVAREESSVAWPQAPSHGGEEEHSEVSGVHAVHSPREKWESLKESGPWWQKAQFLVELPFAVPMYWTLGSLLKRKHILTTFLGSLLWLTVLVTFMIVWLTKSGCLLGISSTAMGLTFGAAGTSMPDCLVSLHVARKGEGNMAVSNVFGSNVFDILFALGLPWVLSTVYLGNEVNVDGSEVLTAVMVGAFVFFAANLAASDFRQSATIGKIYLVLYLVFFVYCFTL